MRQHDVSLTVALCASLALHAFISYALSEQYVRTVGGSIFLPPLPRPMEAAESAEPRRLPEFDPQEDPFRRLGDSEGTGYAIDESPGERQLLARQAPQDQPFLSLDPVGPGRIGDEPSESLVPPGDGAAAAGAHGARAAPVPPIADPVEPVQIGIPLPRDFAPPPSPAPPIIEGTRAPKTAVAAATPPPGAAAVPIPRTDRAAPSPPAGEPGPPVPAADPAPKGESEVDPFSIVETAEFRRGFTNVRLGRKHKLTRPRLTLGAQVELVSIGPTKLALKIKTDATGNVVSCAVEQSSGSPSTDQIFRVTAYEWWFEPPKDAQEKPRADEFLFRISIS